MPPTGPTQRWEGVRAADKHGPACPQPLRKSAKPVLEPNSGDSFGRTTARSTPQSHPSNSSSQFPTSAASSDGFPAFDYRKSQVDKRKNNAEKDKWDSNHAKSVDEPRRRTANLVNIFKRVLLLKQAKDEEVAEASLVQAEECLYLNIFVPSQGEEVPTMLPVLVILGSDSLEHGNSNIYDVSILSRSHNLILITASFRLAILGFLSSGTFEASGNYALLDIVACLKFIRANVANFGGDPNLVTILGYGAGATLVNILLQSPLTKDRGLYRRAIILDSSLYSPTSVATNPSLPIVARRFNCTFSEESVVVECLKAIHPSVFSEEGFVNPGCRPPICLGPVADEILLRKRELDVELPFSINNDKSDVDLMVGLTSSAKVSDVLSLLLTSPDSAVVERLEAVEDAELIRDAIFRAVVRVVFKSQRQKLLDSLLFHYGDWTRPNASADPDECWRQIYQLVSDGFSLAPLVRLVEQRSKFKEQKAFAMKGSTYLFELASLTDYSNSAFKQIKAESFLSDPGQHFTATPAELFPPPDSKGATASWKRLDPLSVLLGTPFVETRLFGDVDRNISRRIMLFLSNFVTYGYHYIFLIQRGRNYGFFVNYL